MSVYVIAEAGVNHNGRVDIAKKLIIEAKKAGCDCIKFQTYKTDLIVTKDAPKAEYQMKNIGGTDNQYEMLKELELSNEDFRFLKSYCEEVGIDFMSTPFDKQSVDFLDEIGVKCFKLSSGDITNKPLIQHIAKKNKPIILSTGMCFIDEISEAVEWIKEMKNESIYILHCTTNYPASYEEVNMKAMDTIRENFQCSVGYSDHTEGIIIPILAASRGAEIIEKHFTIDRNMTGPDHKASLEPDELAEMVKSIRIIESAIGDGKKNPANSELKNRDIVRKSIVSAKNILKGQIISDDDLTVKRPGNGLHPRFLDDIIGKRAAKDITKDCLIESEDIED